MKKIILSLMCSLMLVTFSAKAVITNPAPATGVLPVTADQLLKINSMIHDFTADGTELSYKELVQIGKEAKGSALSLKEKIMLKLFRKKISNNFIEASKEAENGKSSGDGNKSQLVAALLCFFLGGLGIHRFYLGYTWQGIVQILTLGGLGIWVLIDFIRILLGTLKPKDGEYGSTF